MKLMASILGFVLALCACLPVVFADATAARILPNIGYVGRGYNVFFGNPLTTRDPGFRGRMFQFTYGTEMTPDFRYKIPDGVDVVKAQTCSLKFTSELVDTASRYKQAVCSNVAQTLTYNQGEGQQSSNDEIGCKDYKDGGLPKESEKTESTGGIFKGTNRKKRETSETSGSSSSSGSSSGTSSSGKQAEKKKDTYKASFTASKEYKSIKEKTEGHRNVFTLTQGICSEYHASLMDFLPPKLSRNFVAGVKSLPDAYEPARYGRFVASFGTHVTTGILMGARYGHMSQIETTKWRTFTRNEKTWRETVSRYTSVSLFGSQNSQGGAQATEKTNKFKQIITKETFFSVGSKPPADGKASTWARETFANPMPIEYTLRSIDKFLVPDFFQGVQGITNLDKKRENLKKYLDEVCKDLVAKGVIDDCVPQIFRGREPLTCQNLTETYTKLNIPIRSCEANQGFLYYAINKGMHHKDAESACTSGGGHLTSVHSYAERQWIRSFISKMPSATYWLGIRRKNYNCGQGWEWTDGTPVDYSGWAGGEPNCYKGVETVGRQDYGVETWNDVSWWLTHLLPFCKVPI